MKYISIEEAIQKMERFCAYQERSHFQVEKKLRELGLIPEAIDHIILHLLKENFLNEERFAKAYVRGKFYQNKWGKLKITEGLKKHKIHPKLIDKALLEIDENDYLETIKTLINKKQRQYHVKDYKTKQKIARYLYQKGYKYDEFVEYL